MENLPQTKSELEDRLMEAWAMPSHFLTAYHFYALGDDARLMDFLTWLES